MSVLSHRHRLLAHLMRSTVDTVLRHQCQPIPVDQIRTNHIRQLSQQLIATLNHSHGVGLAAPQIGITRRIFVAQLDDAYEHEEDDVKRIANANQLNTGGFKLPPQPSIIINPVIHRRSNRLKYDFEGCLSLPGLVGEINRPNEIEVTYLDEQGELIKRTLTDFRARIFLHEFDHLNGKLFIDHCQSIRQIMTDEGFERTRL